MPSINTDYDPNTTTINQLLHRKQHYYVALIGHPLFGRQVQVAQCGETDTTQWALIAHPDNPELRYRIAQRCLQEEVPMPPDIHGRKLLELTIDYGQLVALANLISEKSSTINSIKR